MYLNKRFRLKHKLAPLALILAGSLAFAACSGSSASSNGSSTPVYRWGVVGNAGKIAQLQLNKPTAVAGISGEVTQIATSNSDSYALTSDGQVWAWGVGSYGELGNGGTPAYDTSAVRVDFPSGVKIVSLPNPMPFDGGLAIDSGGHAWGWGLNLAGDLCLSGQRQEVRPVQLPLNNVTLATGARSHSLFDSNGQVYACGSGDAGELGNGSMTSTSTPTPVIGLPTTAKVTALTSSWEGSGALLSDGSYFNWGYNVAGQLGNGSTTNSAVPVRVQLPAGVRQVSQGGSGANNGQTVAILDNGSVWTWGDNDRGQLGTGSRTSSDVPVQVKVPANTSFVKVNSGGYSSYGIDSSGQLWAWGENNNGQLGTGGGRVIETLPVEVGIQLTQVSSTANNVAGYRNPNQH